MDSAFVMVVVTAVVGVAAWTLTLWVLGESRPLPVAPPRAVSPLDAEPHTVTLLGPDGRPNPARYERLPSYAAALLRQRELSRQGLTCVITHTDSGQVRFDLSAWLGPYGRIVL